MRIISTAEQAALANREVPLALCVEMDLSSPLYLTSADLLGLNIGAITYLGTRGLGTIEAVRSTAAEIAELRFELSGVPSTHVALADGEDVQGKAVRIKLAIYDPATYQILGMRLFWAGTLDTMDIDDQTPTATITVTAEHDGITLLRPQSSLYSDAEQQRLYPGDLFFQYVANQADQRIVWPAASWGRR